MREGVSHLCGWDIAHSGHCVSTLNGVHQFPIGRPDLGLPVERACGQPGNMETWESGNGSKGIGPST